IVNQFGTILVNRFSSTTDTTVFAGGQELVFDRGNVSNTTLIGGLEVIEGSATGFASGFASGTNITANGVQLVFGRAFETTVNSGTQVVWSGGSGFGTVVNGKGSFDFIVGNPSDITGGGAFQDVINGGTEFVVSNGFAFHTTINSGGIQVVSSGATVS